MNLTFRTFKDGDQSGIQKTYSAAFCKSVICQPSNREFWEWKYGPNRPHYAPEGYQVCEYKGKIVGSIMTTLRTMKYNGEVYKVAGIDDVATCPALEKRGIAKRLMENAIKFMEEDQKVDLGILTVGVSGHPRKVYERLGYTYPIYFSIGVKLISVRNALINLTPIIPLALPLRLYGAFRACRRRKDFNRNLKFEILGKNQDEFRQKINENYQNYYSFNEFTQEYWNWYHIERPKSYESVVIAAKENNRIIAGGVITRSYLKVFDNKKWFPVYFITELFVDKIYRGQGIETDVLTQLERAAKQRGVSLVLMLFHGRHKTFRVLLKKMGFIYLDNSVMQLIKPISKRAKELITMLQEEKKKYVWKLPLEQLGY